MALCTNACCNAEVAAAERAVADEAMFTARLEFARRRALDNGQTATRTDVTAEALPRPNESQILVSDRVDTVALGLTCGCTGCQCANLRTITYPNACRDCGMGLHDGV